ncbi:ATP-binding protein [Streptomyces sp. NBC_00322]|uniref:ATP-binding protein n=1 Tax=Streptomyces sp. NBC_00322 TaxID=2975712 RepID=UPI002E27DFD4|nr:ATP-binding protein [Streptomyces sp. NBC_00322]
MKQSAAKTLGVAALGAAFAAAAAGTATAAPALPDSATSLDTVTSVAPVQEALTQLPAGAPESLAGGTSTLPGAVQGAASKVLPNADAADPVGSLLGGLPVGKATSGLPTSGLPTSSLPTGGLPGLGG